MPLLRLPHPHRGLFLLQRERLKNIERICCLLRKVSVRVVQEAPSPAQPPLSVTFFLGLDPLCYLGGSGRLEALLIPKGHGG